MAIQFGDDQDSRARRSETPRQGGRGYGRVSFRCIVGPRGLCEACAPGGAIGVIRARSPAGHRERWAGTLGDLSPPRRGSRGTPAVAPSAARASSAAASTPSGAANHLVPVLVAGGGADAIDAAARRVRDERWPEVVAAQEMQRRQARMMFTPDRWGT